MSLTQAAASFRVFQFEAKLSPDVLSAFAEDAVPPFEVLRDEPLAGWATPRFLTDAEISEETCHAGKFLHLSLTREERRIPKALLTVYCRREELRFMKEKGVNALSRQDRQAIKEAVRKQMLPRTPPSLAGNDVAIDLDRSLLYTDAKTDKQVDLLAERFAKAARTALVPLDAAGAAQRLFNVRVDELAPASFTPENNGDFVVNDVGLDFLTWLYWRFRTDDALFELRPGSPRLAVAIDGPLSLVLEAQGAFQIGLRNGTPVQSREIKSALLGGKKIASLKLFFTLGDDTYQASVSAPSFTVTGLKLPPVDKNRDAAATFVDRMAYLQAFSDAFHALYGVFLRDRADAAAWQRTVAAIRKWLPTMPVKA